MQALLPLLKTFLYSAVGSVVVPWISSKLGVQITADQTTTLQNLTFGGLIGAGSTALHWIHQKLTPNAPTITTKAGAVLPLLLGLLIAGSSGGLTGCAAVQAFLASPLGADAESGIVDLLVQTAEKKGLSAAQINSVANACLTVTYSATPLTSVTQVVQSKIATLPQLDQSAATVFAGALDTAIQAAVANNPSVQTAQADIGQILKDVIAATAATS